MSYEIHQGDALAVLRTMGSDSVDCCITSPPYWGLRDYGCAGQIGLEETPDQFVAKLVEVFAEVRRVLRPDGTCWVNLGDSYAGSWGSQGRQGHGAVAGRSAVAARQIAAAAKKLNRTGAIPEASGLKPKDLCGIPWRVAFALQADGWWLRQDIIWSKPNPMPESVQDRCTKAHEYLFMLSKSAKYFYNAQAIAEPTTETSIKKFTDKSADKQRGHGRRHEGFNGRYAESLAVNGVPTTRNKRSVWTLSTMATPEAHFATYPLELPETCLLAGSREGGLILDPFNGAGTTGLAALKNGRRYVGIELKPEYVEMSHVRFQKYMPLLAVRA